MHDEYRRAGPVAAPPGCYRNGVARFAVDLDFGEWDEITTDRLCLTRAGYTALRKSGYVQIAVDRLQRELLHVESRWSR